MVLYAKLRWQTVCERSYYFTCILMLKYLNGQAPTFLQERFTFVSHGLSTRAEVSGKLAIPQLNVKVFKQCFTYHRPTLWNHLPGDLKNCDSVDAFKFMYKAF